MIENKYLVNQLLIKGGACNSYKTILYGNNNIFKTING